MKIIRSFTLKFFLILLCISYLPAEQKETKKPNKETIKETPKKIKTEIIEQNQENKVQIINKNIHLVKSKRGPIRLKSGKGEKTVYVISKFAKYIPENNLRRILWKKTLVSYKIIDEEGKELYKKDFGLPTVKKLINGETEYVGFEEEFFISGNYKVSTYDGSELLAIGTGFVPSAPNSGWGYHFFGFNSKNEFKYLGKFSSYGYLCNEIKRTDEDKNIDGYIILKDKRYLELAEIAYYFYVVIPYEFNKSEFEFKKVDKKLFDVIVNERGINEEAIARYGDGSVSLYQNPEKNAKINKVSITKKTKMKFIGASYEREKDSSCWLLLEIDGTKGWISNEIGQRDLMKLGFPCFG